MAGRFRRPSVRTTKCPKCGCTELHRDEVDIGVGTIYGPWGCPECGWSEGSEYDLSDGKSAVLDDGSAIDQYGGVHPKGSSMARAYRMAEEAEKDVSIGSPVSCDFSNNGACVAKTPNACICNSPGYRLSKNYDC